MLKILVKGLYEPALINVPMNVKEVKETLQAGERALTAWEIAYKLGGYIAFTKSLYDENAEGEKLTPVRTHYLDIHDLEEYEEDDEDDMEYFVFDSEDWWKNSNVVIYLPGFGDTEATAIVMPSLDKFTW